MIAKFSNSGGDGWKQLFEAMTSSVEEFKGEKVTRMKFVIWRMMRMQRFVKKHETELKMADTD